MKASSVKSVRCAIYTRVSTGIAPSKRDQGRPAINLRAKPREITPEPPPQGVFGNVWDSSQTWSTVKLFWSHSTPAKFS